MLQEEERASKEMTAFKEANASEKLGDSLDADVIRNKTSLIVIAVCVTLSMIFMKSGFLSLFYLAPLGYAALVSGSIKITFAAIALINIVIAILFNLINGNNPQSIFAGNIFIEIIYFSLIFFMFIWVVGGKRVRTVYRFIIASVLTSGAFFLFIWRNENFITFLNDLSKTMSLLFSQTGLSNEKVLSQEALMSSEAVLEFIKSFSLRGGAILSMFLMFFLNYQLTYVVLFLSKRFKLKAANIIFANKKPGFPLGVINFFAPDNTIWILSGSLATVLIASSFKIEIIEILAWNAFVISAILFLTQGAGIIMFWLEKRTAAFRLMTNIFIIFLVFSPLSMIAIIALVLLGIAEIWLPIRIRKLEGDVR